LLTIYVCIELNISVIQLNFQELTNTIAIGKSNYQSCSARKVEFYYFIIRN